MPWSARLSGWVPDILRFAGEGMALAVGLFDASGRELYLNAGIRLLLGMSGEEPCPLEYLVNPPFDRLRDAAPQGEIVYQGWLTFGGGRVPHRSVRGEVRRRGDELLILAEHDVEELERTNREITLLNSEITDLQRELARRTVELEQTLRDLRETQMMLIHSEKMNALGQLVAGVAHEINNPVSFVNSNLHSLRSSVTDIVEAYAQLEALIAEEGTPRQQSIAAQVRREADLEFVFGDLDDLLNGSLEGLGRVKHIVEDLRTFSRLDEAEFKEVRLLDNIRSTLTIVQAELHHRVEVRLDFEDLPPIRCYPAELNQVFLNLIVNAAQAIEGQGTLTIRGRDTGAHQVLEFTDSGRGMAPEVLDRIFEPFFTTKPAGTGTGLGLALAQKIIEDHHRGTLRARSTPGRGSTFIITLPKDLKRHE